MRAIGGAAVRCACAIFLAGALPGGLAAANPVAEAELNAPGHQAIANAIRAKFEAQLFGLTPNTQAHYATRLYRLTGDVRYAYPSLLRVYRVSDRLERIAQNIGRKDFVAGEIQEILKIKPRTSRDKRRRASLKENYDLLFYGGRLLHYLHNLHDFGLRIRAHDRLIAALKGYDFAKYLSDSEIVTAWAAMTSNYVYWLHQLGVADLRVEYKTAFQKAFPDRNDANIDSGEFCHKIYGLTHFIIAGSGYYQHAVDTAEFSWILDYFESRLERIVSDCKADVLAEVGVSFLLARRDASPAVSRLRNAVMAQFDPKHNMILSVDGDHDLEAGEHRNVLAYMLLNWTEALYPGPDFMRTPKLRKYLPSNVVGRGE